MATVESPYLCNDKDTQETQLAVCMGMHERLGANSLLNLLPLEGVMSTILHHLLPKEQQLDFVTPEFFEEVALREGLPRVVVNVLEILRQITCSENLWDDDLQAEFELSQDNEVMDLELMIHIRVGYVEDKIEELVKVLRSELCAAARVVARNPQNPEWWAFCDIYDFMLEYLPSAATWKGKAYGMHFLARLMGNFATLDGKRMHHPGTVHMFQHFFRETCGGNILCLDTLLNTRLFILSENVPELDEHCDRDNGFDEDDVDWCEVCFPAQYLVNEQRGGVQQGSAAKRYRGAMESAGLGAEQPLAKKKRQLPTWMV